MSNKNKSWGNQASPGNRNGNYYRDSFRYVNQERPNDYDLEEDYDGYGIDDENENDYATRSQHNNSHRKIDRNWDGLNSSRRNEFKQ